MSNDVKYRDTVKVSTVVYIILGIVVPLWIISLPLFWYLAYKSYKAGEEPLQLQQMKQEKETSNKEFEAKTEEFLALYLENQESIDTPVLKNLYERIALGKVGITQLELQQGIDDILQPKDNSLGNMEKIKKLGALRKEGLISEQEFLERKNKLLAEI